MTNRLERGDDRGATLLLALFIITTVALVVGALMTSVDTSERTTIALRAAAASTYNGDAAGEVAVNTLRKSTWNNSGNCFGASSSLSLNNFYPATTGAAPSSAFVSCVGESGTGAQGSPVAISSLNKPGNAVLTLGTSAAEDGQDYGQSSQAITIRGGVVSDSNIVAKSSSTLSVTAGATVRAVSGCSGTITPSCTMIASPGITDPNYAAPSASLVLVPASLPTCKNKKVAEFQPGLYTSAQVLNDCNATGALMHFNPGTYFFDFQDPGATHVWTTSTTVVAGTPTSTLDGANPPDVSNGACVNPIESATAVGDLFVFGGDSQLALAKGAAFELCASYSATSIPTAVYGLKSNLTNGSLVAHAQSGCVILASGCDLISDGANGTKPTFYFEGFVYAPRASVSVAVNNTAKPFFNFGVVLRHLSLTSTASASGAAYISLPDNSPGFGTADTIADLTVFVCSGSSSCSASGKVKLRARVRINDPTGSPIAGSRQITILSWSLMP
jgi:Tfp pilus assembly protein PilX